MSRIRQFYEVTNIEGTHGLHISNMSNESFELTIEEIDEAVKRAKAQGYNNDEKWLVIEVVREKEWSDNGAFLWEKSLKKAVALYDNGKVTKLKDENEVTRLEVFDVS